jgi:putative peptidoglycan lipid II flippase
MASIGRSSALLASGTVVSRILGFISAVVLARTLGLVGSGADAFALANQLPNNIYAIVAGGVLSAVLVPHIIKSHLNPDGGAAYINKLLTLGIVIFGLIALLATLAAPLLVSLYAQQTSGANGAGFDSVTVQLAVAFAWWCLPQVFFYAVYSLLGEVLNARGLFGPFTWAPALNNIVAIAGMLWLGTLFTGSVTTAGDWGSLEISVLAGSATVGVAAQSLILFGFLRRAGIRFRLDFGFRGVGLRDTSKVAAWTFGMIIVTQIAGVVQSNVASLATATGDPGLAVLRFGWLVFMLPHSVVTVSLVTAYFTRMSTAVRDNNWVGLSRDIRESLARIGFFMVLASAGLWVTSAHIAAVFSSNAAAGLGVVVSLFALALVPFGVVFVLQRVFYALGDTKTPFYIQIAQAVVFCVGAVITAIGPTSQIAFGLALSLSVSTWVHALVMGLVLNKRLGKLFDITEISSLGKFVLALVPTVVLGWLTSEFINDVFSVSITSSLTTHLLAAAVVGVVMIGSYVGSLLLLRDATTRSLLAPLRRGDGDRT